MPDRLRVVILFGGQSGEHEVSVNSAQSVLQAIDRTTYEVETVGISPDGRWHWGVQPEKWLTNEYIPNGSLVTLVHDPLNPHFITLDGSPLPNDGAFDLIFPVLHGPYGEDGTVQGLFEMCNIPYAGSGVLGSALGMDKDRMKAVFSHAGLPQAHYVTFLRSKFQTAPEEYLDAVEQGLGYPCFVKPANLGSSVGISKAYHRQELIDAINMASIYDRKIIVEQNVQGREIEVSVLGNDLPQASLPGEILPAHEFYDYEAKYLDAGSRLLIPAPLKDEVVIKLRAMAVKAFKAIDACGLARVDFFVTEEDDIFVNEINTMPGFTKISMYPKLWEATGISYSDLISRLVTLGIERHQDNRNRKITRQ